MLPRPRHKDGLPADGDVLLGNMSKRRAGGGGNRRPAGKLGVVYETLSLGGSDYPAFKTAMHEAAVAASTEWLAIMEGVRDKLRLHDPVMAMACFASYGLTMVSTDGGSTRKPLSGIHQHHAELLQALMLTIAPEDWGTGPIVPDAMQSLFDDLPRLFDAFFLQRTLAAENLFDEQEIAAFSLQERVRLHTMGVRNWAHFGSVHRISAELYGALDARFATYYGFGCTDLIDLMHSVVTEFERRQTEHWARFHRVLRGKSVRQVFRLYFKEVPDLVGDAETMLAAWPGGSVDAAKAAVMAHYDLRLSRCGEFTSDEIASSTGRPKEIVERVLRSLSLAPGALAGQKVEHLFLGNPVWQTPVVDLGEVFFLPMPQAFFSHVHRVMDRLAAEAGLKHALEAARPAYLQRKLEQILTAALPGATVKHNVKWRVGDQQFETDVLAVVDRTVLIAEAKANHLTPEGLRGAPARVKRHVQEMVLAPSLQSERLAKLVAAAKSGDAFAVATAAALGIDPSAVDGVVRLSVTLDDFSVLSAAEGEFKKVGWVPADHDLAPTITVADLLCVVDILDSPVSLLHYLSGRSRLQKAATLLGDELDYFGLYLETGFHLELPECDSALLASGMSATIDRYYDASDAGISTPKPKARMGVLFSRIVGRLAQSRPESWTTLGLLLLDAAGPAEQVRFERSLDGLRAAVRKHNREPGHVNTIFFQPKRPGGAQVGFYLFPERLAGEAKLLMQSLAREALEASDVGSIVLFGRCTDNWDLPYQLLLRMKRR
jgi:hypothetical protein